MKIQRTLFFAIVFIGGFTKSTLVAQTSNWLWAKHAGGTDMDLGSQVCSGTNNDLLAVGTFYSTTFAAGNFTLTNANTQYSSMYLTRYDINGNVIWTTGASSTYSVSGEAVSVDSHSHPIVAGAYSGTLVLGPNVLNGYGVYVAKYDSSGNVIWARNAVDTCGNSITSSVCTDSSDNVYVLGTFTSPWLIFGTTVLHNAGAHTTDIFLVKYDANGNLLWAKNFGNSAIDLSTSVKITNNNSLVFGGTFCDDTLFLDAIALTRTLNSSSDVFVAKCDLGGNVIWAKNAGGQYGGSQCTSLSVDQTGNVFITGFFESQTLDFGTTVLTKAGYTDIFLTKYNTNGQVLWAKQASSEIPNNGINYSHSCCTDANGNVYISGEFSPSGIFFQQFQLTCPNGSVQPLFLTQYDSSGNVNFATVLSQGGNSNNDICTDLSGNLYLTGHFDSNPFVIGSDSLTPYGNVDMFIAKYGPSTLGWNDFSNTNNLNIFPNPGNGIFTIDANFHTGDQLEIFDSFGRKVFESKQINANHQEINLGNQANGVYFVRVVSEGKSFTARIIKQ